MYIFQKIEKNTKWYHYFTAVYQKSWYHLLFFRYRVWQTKIGKYRASELQKFTHMWRRRDTPQNFVLAFIDELWKTWKMRILKKWKNQIAGDIIILHVYQKPQSYEVQFLRHRVRQNFFFSFCAIFCTFTPHPPNNPENQNLEMSSF